MHKAFLWVGLIMDLVSKGRRNWWSLLPLATKPAAHSALLRQASCTMTAAAWLRGRTGAHCQLQPQRILEHSLVMGSRPLQTRVDTHTTHRHTRVIKGFIRFQFNSAVQARWCSRSSAWRGTACGSTWA